MQFCWFEKTDNQLLIRDLVYGNRPLVKYRFYLLKLAEVLGRRLMKLLKYHSVSISLLHFLNKQMIH